MFGMDGNQRGLITALALLVSVFMAGVLSAVAVVTVLERGDVAEAEHRRPGPPRRGGPGGLGDPRDGPWGFDGRGDFILDMLTQELDLSEEQRERIGEVMASREERAQEIMAGMRDRLTSIMDSIDAEIQAVLTPEQVEAYRQLRADGRDRLERRYPGPPGRRPPPDRRRPPRRNN